MRRSDSLAGLAVSLLAVALPDVTYAVTTAQSFHFFLASLFAVAGVNAMMTALIDRDWVIGASRETLINCRPDNNQHGKRKCDFRFPSFSTPCRHRKWRHILVPRETRRNRRFPRPTMLMPLLVVFS